MSKLTAINTKQHANLKLAESTDYTRFKEQHLIPVVMQDFANLAAEFPIVFVKNTETDQLIPVAMMGLKKGINLYCQDQTWTSHVKPIGFLNYPLTFVKKSQESNEYVVCFDEESGLVTETEGQALFDDKGEQSAYLKARTEALLKVVEYTEKTQVFSQYLSDNKLLVSQNLNINLAGSDEAINIDGIYIVDEKVLTELPIDKLDELRSRGLLGLIYAHLVSIKQISRLTAKHREFEAK